MTNAELIQKIRAEIERNRHAIKVLNEHTAPEQMSKTCAIFQYSDSILSELLSFLSTLEESEEESDLQDAEVVFSGHALHTDVTKWADGYKLKIRIYDDN